MRLIDLLHTFTNPDVNSGIDQSDYSRMMQSVRLFLAGREDIDSFALVDPDFVMRYCRYLFDGQYARELVEMRVQRRKGAFTRSTAEKHYRYLRTIARHAARAGYLPAIDVFQAVKAEYERQRGGQPAGPAREYRLAGNDYQAELGRLVDHIADDIRDKSRVRSAVPALVYVLGIYCRGMEIAELLQMPASTAEPGAEYGVRGMRCAMAERALGVAAILNRQKPGDGRLLRTHADWQGLQGAELAEHISAGLEKYLKDKGICLYRNRSVFADWLGMAKQAGMADADISALARGQASDGLAARAEAVGRRLGDDHGALHKRWHVLASYSPKLQSSDLKDAVKAFLKSQGIDFNAGQDLYDPQDIKRKEVRGKMIKKNNPTISRFLFVKCQLGTARMIDAMSQRASMLRLPGDKRRLATVPHSAIVTLASFLKDYREEVELIGLEQSADKSEFGCGVKVRILSGELKGLTGVITKVAEPYGPATLPGAVAPKTRTEALMTREDASVYTIALDGFAIAAKAQAQLPGLELEPIED